MPIVLSNKQRIHYEVDGDRGPFLLVHPPFLETIESLYRQNYVEQLKDHYRLILLDPLGQGRSDAPLDVEQYTIQARSQHIVDLMRELNVDNFHFMGMDIGAQVAFFMGTHMPKRIRSLTTIGGHPYPVTTETKKIQEWIQELRATGISAYTERLKNSEDLSPEREKELLAYNSEACAASLEAICQWKGVGETLNKIYVPGLLFTATSEEKFLAIREAGRSMPRARYVILPELNFTDGLLDAELTIPHFMEFVRRQRRPD